MPVWSFLGDIWDFPIGHMCCFGVDLGEPSGLSRGKLDLCGGSYPATNAFV